MRSLKSVPYLSSHAYICAYTICIFTSVLGMLIAELQTMKSQSLILKNTGFLAIKLKTIHNIILN